MAQSFMSLKGGLFPHASAARKQFVNLDRFLERYLQFWFSSKRTGSQAIVTPENRPQRRRSA